MAADPKMSDGAARERRAFRDHLRRAIAKGNPWENPALERELAWVMKRQERYDAADGGLGKKLARKGVRR